MLKLNSDAKIESLDKMKENMNADIEEANSIAQELESSLGSHNESSKLIKDDIKRLAKSFTRVREALLKCEDTSGTDEQLYERLKSVREHQESLNKYEADVAAIQQKITTMQEEFGSGDVKSLMKEF